MGRDDWNCLNSGFGVNRWLDFAAPSCCLATDVFVFAFASCRSDLLALRKQ